MQVPDTEFSYEIYIGSKLPMFTFTPQSIEIYHRLILRATLTTSLSELEMKTLGGGSEQASEDSDAAKEDA